MRRIAAFLVLCLAAPADACTFCAGSLIGRQTLREQYANAPIVVQGRLKNPKFDASGFGGTTELHIDHVLKTDPDFGSPKVIVLPKYIPVIGDTPPDYLVFGDVTNGRFDVITGLPATATAAEYLRGLTKLPPKDTTRRLGYCFTYLDAKDEAVAADAFLELGKASDTDLVNAKAVFDSTKLRAWLIDLDTAPERLGVYAMLLGVSGTAKDAEVFIGLLSQTPRPERVSGSLGGILAGYVLLDPKVGWELTASLLGDKKHSIGERIAAVGTLRFFQATRPKESRAEVLRCCRELIRQGELADLAIEDLRRWGWWDLTPEVLAAYTASSPPILRRGVVRYALTCPDEEAKAFIARVRQQDSKLVAGVEESLKLYEAITPTEPRP